MYVLSQEMVKIFYTKTPTSVDHFIKIAKQSRLSKLIKVIDNDPWKTDCLLLPTLASTTSSLLFFVFNKRAYMAIRISV